MLFSETILEDGKNRIPVRALNVTVSGRVVAALPTGQTANSEVSLVAYSADQGLELLIKLEHCNVVYAYLRHPYLFFNVLVGTNEYHAYVTNIHRDRCFSGCVKLTSLYRIMIQDFMIRFALLGVTEQGAVHFMTFGKNRCFKWRWEQNETPTKLDPGNPLKYEWFQFDKNFDMFYLTVLNLPSAGGRDAELVTLGISTQDAKKPDVALFSMNIAQTSTSFQISLEDWNSPSLSLVTPAPLFFTSVTQPKLQTSPSNIIMGLFFHICDKSQPEPGWMRIIIDSKLNLPFSSSKRWKLDIPSGTGSGKSAAFYRINEVVFVFPEGGGPVCCIGLQKEPTLLCTYNIPTKPLAMKITCYGRILLGEKDNGELSLIKLEMCANQIAKHVISEQADVGGWLGCSARESADSPINKMLEIMKRLSAEGLLHRQHILSYILEASRWVMMNSNDIELWKLGFAISAEQPLLPNEYNVRWSGVSGRGDSETVFSNTMSPAGLQSNSQPDVGSIPTLTLDADAPAFPRRSSTLLSPRHTVGAIVGSPTHHARPHSSAHECENVFCTILLRDESEMPHDRCLEIGRKAMDKCTFAIKDLIACVSVVKEPRRALKSLEDMISVLDSLGLHIPNLWRDHLSKLTVQVLPSSIVHQLVTNGMTSLGIRNVKAENDDEVSTVYFCKAQTGHKEDARKALLKLRCEDECMAQNMFGISVLNWNEGHQVSPFEPLQLYFVNTLEKSSQDGGMKGKHTDADIKTILNTSSSVLYPLVPRPLEIKQTQAERDFEALVFDMLEKELSTVMKQ